MPKRTSPEPNRPESDSPHPDNSNASPPKVGWGAALLMAAAPFLLLGLLILADRMLR